MANDHTRRDAVSGSGDLTADWGPQGLQITDARPRPVWARITGVAGGTNRYSWAQVNESDTTLPDLGSGFGMSGTTTAGQWPAYEVTGNGSVATGTKVQIWPSPAGQFWLFFHPTGVTAGITAEEQDGSPSYTSTTTLRFDQGDGFVLTQPAAGVTRIDIQGASGAQPGVVTGGYQVWNGSKTFNGSVIVAGPGLDVYGDAIVYGTLTSSEFNSTGWYSIGGIPGWTGTFATGDARTATVGGGIITDVS